MNLLRASPNRLSACGRAFRSALMTPAALGKQPAPISPVLGRSGMRESPGRRFGAFSLSAPGARVSAFSSLGHFSAGELAGDGAACILIIGTQIICGLAR
jgi:hypothetical protein